MPAPAPYRPGAKFTIQKHVPPQPFGDCYNGLKSVRKPLDSVHLQPPADRIQIARFNPPIEAESLQTAEIEAAESRTITIVKKLGKQTRGKGGGPHVLECYLDSDSSVHYAAKVYDGAYYPLYDFRGLDCMYLADQDYSCEAAAYGAIPPALLGTAVPGYFGSWTLFVQHDDQVAPFCRPVRMILMEFVDGEVLHDVVSAAGAWQDPDGSLDVSEVDESQLPNENERLDVLAAVIETDVAVFHAGISHSQVVLDDVLVSNTLPRRVVLFDFHLAIVYHLYEAGRRFLKRRGTRPLPISPVQRWWGNPLYTDFAGWVPDWMKDDKKRHEWLCSRWMSSNRYMPPSQEFLAEHPFVQDYQRVREEEEDLETPIELE